MKCSQCPRDCQIDREKQIGFCCVKDEIQVAKIIKNFMWEEPALCFDKGVTAVFFAGCNLKCEFCQNLKISRYAIGNVYSPKEFAKLLEELDSEDIDGIDLISPTQFTNKILEAFEIYKPKHKVIWNSNGYEKVENVEKLARFVDVFLPDFKYFDDDLAVRLSQAQKYRDFCIEAIKKMSDLKPTVMHGQEMKQGVIVRHLVLPGETKDSLKVLDEIKRNFPNFYVSLMSQFIPNGCGEKKRKLEPLEYKIVVAYFNKIGLKNGFVQEILSANESFIPNF